MPHRASAKLYVDVLGCGGAGSTRRSTQPRQAGPAGAHARPVDVLEHILEHIIVHLHDIDYLRLTARVFRYHPAVMQSCSRVSLYEVTTQQLQSGLTFLQRLPNLQLLHLCQPKTLLGVHTLTQLECLEISHCEHLAIDVALLSFLPGLQELRLLECRAQQLINLSELRCLTRLSLAENNVDAEIAHLTNLRELDINPDKSTPDMKASGQLYSGLSGLTSLYDNALGAPYWSALPNLLHIDVFSRFLTLIGVTFPSSLRALCLYTDDRAADDHLYLEPLSALSRLERLKIFGPAPRMPRLESLKSLFLEFQGANNCVPDLAGLPGLQGLHLSLSSDLVLPYMGDASSLSWVFFICNSHTLTMDIRDNGRFSCEPVYSIGPIDQDLEA